MMKLTSVILLFATLLSCLCIGCADTDGEEKYVSGNGANGGSNPEKDEYGRPWVDSALPSTMDFGDETFTILGGSGGGISDFYSESMSGDIVSNAVYMRNLNAQDKLGFELEFFTVADRTDVPTIISENQMSGGNAYQLALIGAYPDISYMLDGYFTIYASCRISRLTARGGIRSILRITPFSVNCTVSSTISTSARGST